MSKTKSMILREELIAEDDRLRKEAVQPKPCPLCGGLGKLEPDPNDYLLAVGSFELWRDRKATAFFWPFLPSEENSQDFLTGMTHSADYIRDQTVRLIGIADTLRQVGTGGDTLIMLLVIVAENVAKLFFGFEGERKSKEYVRRFFLELSPADIQAALLSAVKDAQIGDDPYKGAGHMLYDGRRHPKVVTDIKSAVTLLYKVRCDVVHEGRYREFFVDCSAELRDRTYFALRECVIRTVIAVLRKCP